MHSRFLEEKVSQGPDLGMPLYGPLRGSDGHAGAVMTAWRIDPEDSPAIAHWKAQVRYWQAASTLAFMAGAACGIIVTMLFVWT